MRTPVTLHLQEVFMAHGLSGKGCEYLHLLCLIRQMIVLALQWLWYFQICLWQCHCSWALYHFLQMYHNCIFGQTGVETLAATNVSSLLLAT